MSFQENKVRNSIGLGAIFTMSAVFAFLIPVSYTHLDYTGHVLDHAGAKVIVSMKEADGEDSVVIPSH